jgi:hypothetical protein
MMAGNDRSCGLDRRTLGDRVIEQPLLSANVRAVMKKKAFCPYTPIKLWPHLSLQLSGYDSILHNVLLIR